MSKPSLSSVATELNIHLKECSLRSKVVEKELNALTYRVRRLEHLIMGSTFCLLGSIIALFVKG